jgi:hypothetical protein
MLTCHGSVASRGRNNIPILEYYLPDRATRSKPTVLYREASAQPASIQYAPSQSISVSYIVLLPHHIPGYPFLLLLSVPSRSPGILCLPVLEQPRT